MSVGEIFDSFNRLNVLIIGDVMIDNYFWGKVERISPEAPVPIVSVNKKESRMGGAANVAINIQALGAKPILCSVIGDDTNSKLFFELMDTQGLSKEGIIPSKGRITTVKTRIIGNNHQMLRVDEEVDHEISPQESHVLLTAIRTILDSKKIDVIIFEDYDKGVLNASLISSVIAEAITRKIPTTVDPKKRNFHLYRNVSLLKPNLKELKEGLKTEFNHLDISDLRNAVDKLQAQQNAEIALVTLSEHGIYISSKTHKKLIPAYIRNIADVSGAGDTVISVASLCLALKLDPDKIATLANLAGGLVCEKTGVVAIDKNQLFNEASAIYTK